MDLSQSTDYLKLTENRLAQPFVNNDIVLFSDEIEKINRYWTPQKRILWITSKYVLNLKRDKDRLDDKGNPDLSGLSMKRIINVSSLRGVTKSLHHKSFEFVIHVPTEYDYRYQTKNERLRDEIIKSLKLAYLTEWREDLLIYGVPERYLGKYTKTNSNGKTNKIPHSKFVIPGECLNFINSVHSDKTASIVLEKKLTLEDEFFEIIPYEERKRQGSKIKKSKSEDISRSASIDDRKNFDLKEDDISSNDEEQKFMNELSDDENDILFDLEDEDIDIFGERSETIYSKHDKSDNIKAKDFTLKKLLRTTDIGKVYLAEYKKNNQWYALKSIKKDQFLKRFKSIDVLNDLNDQLNHPFICSIEFALQNEFRVYLVSQLLKGGELESLLKKEGTLKEDLARFYCAQIVIAIGYMHDNNIIYRNLK